MSVPYWVFGAAAAVVAAGLLVACRSTGEPLPARHLDARDVARGTDSSIVERDVFIARDRDTWETLWASHARLRLPAPPAPEVDFSSSMVVAVFCGECPSAGYGVEIGGVDAYPKEEGPTEIVVRARMHEPPKDAVTAQMVTTPFHFVTVPASDGEPVLVID